jgi:PAS domain S-box-containing protein
MFYHGSLLDEILSPDPHETWMRSFIVFLFIVFGIYAQSMVNSRKRAQQKAELASAHLDLIIKTIPDGVCVIDRFFTIVQVSPTFLTLLSITEDEAIGRNCYNVLPSPFCKTPKCSLTQIMRGEKERIEWDMDRGRKNGTKIALNVVATPVSSPDSEIVGIVNSFRKVSST